MPAVTVTIDSSVLRQLTAAGGDVDKDMERRARNVLNQAVLMAPVDTGRMRASGVADRWTDGAPGSWEVSFPVEYSFYVDHGTRLMPARPFLTDALPYALI